MHNSIARIRERAVIRGLNFIYRISWQSEAFDAYGYDYLFSFSCISVTSQSPAIRNLARKMGRVLARRWRETHAVLPQNLDADILTAYVFAGLSANGLGIGGDFAKSQIADWARSFTACDYFWFEAEKEPPPADVPEECSCGSQNPRGSSYCLTCAEPLGTMSRYEVWVVALIRSYFGERYGVTLGSQYGDVLKWLNVMRPYPGPGCEPSDDFIWSIYAATHVVYTLNDYSLYKLSPDWLPDEYEFLKKNISETISMDDPETVGEIIEALRSFGLGEENASLRDGMDYLLSTQNADGSWGDPNIEDFYDRYHPTLTAINALREFEWRGTRLSFPEVKPLLGLEPTSLSTASRT